jgi:hypothetical protein
MFWIERVALPSFLSDNIGLLSHNIDLIIVCQSIDHLTNYPDELARIAWCILAMLLGTNHVWNLLINSSSIVILMHRQVICLTTHTRPQLCVQRQTSLSKWMICYKLCFHYVTGQHTKRASCNRTSSENNNRITMGERTSACKRGM